MSNNLGEIMGVEEQIKPNPINEQINYHEGLEIPEGQEEEYNRRVQDLLSEGLSNEEAAKRARQELAEKSNRTE
jgi:hypothetical protein